MQFLTPFNAMSPLSSQSVSQQRNGALFHNGEKLVWGTVQDNVERINPLLTKIYPHSITAPIRCQLESLVHEALNPQQTLLDVYVTNHTLNIRQEGQEAFSVTLPLNDIQIKREGLAEKIRAITTRHLRSILADLASIVPNFKK